MIFRQARGDDSPAVFALYQSVIGSEFCIWNVLYPTADDIRRDVETGNLFVLCDGDRMAGAVSIVPENEMDDMPCWSTSDGTEREIARVVIAKAYQGKGMAAGLVRSVIDVLKARNCRTVRLSVAAENIPARKTYDKVGFVPVGEADMYCHHYYLLEKTIL